LKAIVLAGGYAKRLYPITQNQAKSLLPVAGRLMIERLLDCLTPIPDLASIHIVTNDKFHPDFCKWLDAYRPANGHVEISITNNGSREGSCEIGAIGNLHLVLDQEMIDDDIIVVASDNLFSQSLEGFAGFARSKNSPVVACYTMEDTQHAGQYGYIEVDNEGRVTFFEEKPAEVRGPTIGVALYYYPKSSLPLIRKYIDDRHNSEEPGRLVEWMYKRTPFFAWPVPGIWCDIGSKQKLEDANRLFARVDKAAV